MFHIRGCLLRLKRKTQNLIRHGFLKKNTWDILNWFSLYNCIVFRYQTNKTILYYASLIAIWSNDHAVMTNTSAVDSIVQQLHQIVEHLQSK